MIHFFFRTAGSVAMLTLSHVAQSMVVVIVGLSMGFRSISVSATSTIDIYTFFLHSFLFWIGKKTSIYGGSFLGQGRV
jgi:hypothetical protein